MKGEEYEFELTSVCPLKMDRWTDDKPPKTEEGYKLIAPNKAYKNTKGFLSIPSAAIKAAMRVSASEVGKKMEGKKNRQTIKSGIFFNEEMLQLNSPKKEADEIVRDIVTRGIGDKVTRVATYRPLVKSWKVRGTLTSYGADEQFIKDCLQLAGTRYGVLSHRPEFGRFVISKWKAK